MGRKKRNTRQKEIIKKELSKIEIFFDADFLYSRVIKKDKNIGIATIYRYLKEAKKNGELYSYKCNRRTIYSVGKKSHCHFECEKTGKIIHFDIGNIDFLKDNIPGEIKSFQLEVKGICNECKNHSKNLK